MDDYPLRNYRFSEAMEQVEKEQVNKLERHFNQTMDYRFYVSGHEYARYHYALRALPAIVRRVSSSSRKKGKQENTGSGS